MAFVHQEANWGARAGALHKNRTRTDSACSDSHVESSTIEIAVALTEARDVMVIAVTADQELRAVLREVLPKDGLTFADSPEQVLTRPAPTNCAVLIVEQTLGRSIFEGLKSHIKQTAPALVTIMIGTGDNGSSLVARLSAGHIDRFMVKPFNLGPTRSALRSALVQHRSLRQCSLVEGIAKPDLHNQDRLNPDRLNPDRLKTGQDKAVFKREREIPAADVELVPETRTDELIRGETPRRRTLPTWGIAFGAAIACVTFVVVAIFGLDFSERVPALSKDKVLAGPLAAASRAFELGNYVDPEGLSAAHFYAAALELDPSNVQAKRGLEAVADRLIANGKDFIVAGDLLRAQSTLDSARRIQPNHRELADVMASLLGAREAERATLQAARAFVKGSAEPVEGVPAQVVQSTSHVTTKASANAEPRIETKVKVPSQPKALVSQVHSVAPSLNSSTGVGVPTPGKALEDLQPANVAAPSLKLNPPSVEASIPKNNPTENPVSAIETPRVPMTPVPMAATDADRTLTKYVAPVYPERERVEGIEGWIEVNFRVASDGTVIDPSIGKRGLSPSMRRATLKAVSQWRYSPAPGTPDRPMTVRVQFKLADSKRT